MLPIWYETQRDKNRGIVQQCIAGGGLEVKDTINKEWLKIIELSDEQITAW